MCCKALSLLLLLSGCVHSGASAIDPAPSVIVRVDDLRERAHMRFERALFLKPEASEVDLPLELAPLFVQDVTSMSDVDVLSSPIGALAGDRLSGFRCDFDRPTVYVSKVSITLRKRKYALLTFGWYHRATPLLPATTPTVVRLVLDEQELPLFALVHQAKESDQQRCTGLFFVSESLEQAAKERFGEPLPGREFAIEREPESDCSPIVVRTFEPGPVPMGPYVYLDQHGNVTTLLCRCSPSQMDEVVYTKRYRLEPFERVREMRISSELSVLAQPIPTSLWMMHYIDQALRWPYDPPSDATSNENRRNIP
jgi:hypothetical protein